MRHNFKLDVLADCRVCQECGYVWGEDPYQNCPMRLENRGVKK